MPRARFRIDEVVQLTLDVYRRNCIGCLFLNLGIVPGPDHTMEQMVAVACCPRESKCLVLPVTRLSRWHRAAAAIRLSTSWWRLHGAGSMATWRLDFDASQEQSVRHLPTFTPSPSFADE